MIFLNIKLLRCTYIVTTASVHCFPHSIDRVQLPVANLEGQKWVNPGIAIKDSSAFKLACLDMCCTLYSSQEAQRKV